MKLTKRTLCWKLTDLSFEIELHQYGRTAVRGKDSFAVKYGEEVTTGDYEEACLELGKSILHALACEGRVDNRLKGEE